MHKVMAVLGAGAGALLVQMFTFSATLALAAGESAASGVEQRVDVISRMLGGVLGIVFIYVFIIRPILKRRKKQ